MHIYSRSSILVVLIDLSSLQWQKTSRDILVIFPAHRASCGFHVPLRKHIIGQTEMLERLPAYTFLHKLMIVRVSLNAKFFSAVGTSIQCTTGCQLLGKVMIRCMAAVFPIILEYIHASLGVYYNYSTAMVQFIFLLDSDWSV